MFWGYLDEHSSPVANVCCLSNVHISLHFHVVSDDLFKTVICNGDNDLVVNSICDGLFNWNCKLHVEDEFDDDDVLIDNPPPLLEVWLNEAGRCQVKEELLRQCCQHEDLMHARCQEIHERVGLTPPSPVTNSVPNDAIISDDESMDSSVCSQHSELKGELRDNDDGFVHIPQPLPAPNIVNEGANPNIILEVDSQVNAPGRAAIPPAKISEQGLVGILANILLLNGFVVLMESCNILISASLNSRMLLGNSTKIYLLLHLVQGVYLPMLRQCQEKRRE
jgi:hypothetical protein